MPKKYSVKSEMKKFITVLLIMLLAFSMIACGDDSASDSSSDNPTAEAEKTEKADDEDSGFLENEGDIGDYHCAIKKSKMTKDWEDKPAIIINYEFTNNSDSATSFDMALDAKAYQNGVELDTSYGNDENESYMKDVKPGTTFKIKRVYLLDDEKAPVEVEVGEFFSLNDDVKVVKTFDITR